MGKRERMGYGESGLESESEGGKDRREEDTIRNER